MNITRSTILCLILSPLAAMAQWTTNGADIHNTNTGNVGIGTINPRTKFHIYGDIIPSISNTTPGETIRLTRKGNYSEGQQEVSMGIFLSKYAGTDANSRTRADFTLSNVGSVGNAWGTDLSVISPVMTMLGNGNVGIGTTNPTVKLEVNGDANIGINEGSTTGYGARLQFLGASLNGDYLWLSRYNNGENKSELRVNIGDDYGQSEDMFVVGTHYWNGNNWHPHLTVQASGKVGIGTSAPDAKLTVNGDIHTREVRVDMDGPLQGPDYVFEKDYNLLPLAELEAYINQNKHLPEVPSAKEMEANGLNLKEMNLLLLKKVEELTLHLIDANKKIESLDKQVQSLKNNNK